MLKGLGKMANVYGLEVGDQVAIFPVGKAASDALLEVAAISYIRAFTVQLSNGKLYARMDGRGLVTNDYIVPATDAHWAELERRLNNALSKER
jgi:hypothetical protein